MVVVNLCLFVCLFVSPAFFLIFLNFSLPTNEPIKTAGKRKEDALPLKRHALAPSSKNYPSPFFRFENRVLFLPIDPAEIPPDS